MYLETRNLPSNNSSLTNTLESNTIVSIDQRKEWRNVGSLVRAKSTLALITKNNDEHGVRSRVC